MLRLWYETNCLGEELEEVDTEEEAEPDLPSRGATKEGPQCEISDHLNEEQRAEFKDTLQTRLGRTQVTEHYIHTGAERPVKLPPYRLPYAYRRTVEKEMLKGVISRSASEWAALIVKKRWGASFLRRLPKVERNL